jgi:hypothetical protein
MDHRVSVNGKEAFEEQEISGEVEISLGNGVKLKIEVIDERPPEKEYDDHEQTGTTVRSNRQVLRWVTAVVPLILVLIYLIADQSAGLEGDISELRGKLSDIDAAPPKVISEETINIIRNSVYVVVKQNQSGGEALIGTAWVTEGRRLATNAHVADVFQKLASHERLLVRASVSPHESFYVTEAKLHPGFEAYARLWKDYFPAQLGLKGFEVMQTISPADVALLSVSEAAQLAPPLRLASREQARTISPGLAVGFVGFPSERLLPGSLKQPSPVAQQDELVRITNFFMVNEKDNNRLIQHGLPLTGGASGSPLFSAEGKVIGIISAINTAKTISGRYANPADINFAQGIDFLYDLLEETADEKLEDYIAYWTKNFKQFHQGLEGSSKAVVEAVQQAHHLGAPNYSGHLKGSLSFQSQRQKKRSATRSIKAEGAGLHLVVAKSIDKRLKLTVSRNGRIFPQYDYPVPYSNLVAYSLLITDKEETLDVTLSATSRAAASEAVDYELDFYSWDQVPNSLRESMSLIGIQTRTGSKAKPTLAHYSQSNQANIFFAKSQVYVSEVKLRTQQKGHYLVVGLPLDNNPLDAVLYEGKKKLAKDVRPNSEITFYYHQKDDTGVDLSVLTLAKEKDSRYDLKLYFWPAEEQQQ